MSQIVYRKVVTGIKQRVFYAGQVRIGIKTKLALFSTVIIVILVLSIGYLSYNKSGDMLFKFTEEMLLNNGKIYADMIDKYIYERSRDVLIMAEHPLLMDAKAPAEEKSALLSKFKADYGHYDTISLTDTKGLQIADSDGTVGMMKNELEWFKSAIQGNLYISDVRLSIDLQKPIINFAGPVRDDDGNIIGTITTRLILEDSIWAMVDEFAVAQQEAGKSGYAYIINKEGVFMAHPVREMILRDNVLQLGVEELATAGQKMIRGESGFARYSFEGVDKYVAYVPLDGWGGYEGMGWSIALTSPVNDFLAPVYSLRNYILVLGIVAVLVGLALMLVVAQKMVQPINEILDSVRQVARGDLTKQVRVNTADEIGDLAGGFNQMINSLRDIVAKVQDNSFKLSSHSQELAASGQQVSAAMEEVTGTTGEVAATSQQSADNAREAEKESMRMREVAGEGHAAVSQALDKINIIAENSKMLSGAVEDLGRQSNRIGQITGAIIDIAEQTNLLALNAAIEAARAGEHGRGFAVVAEEVRKLAEQSGRAADEITGLIKQVQGGVDKAIAATKQSVSGVEEGVVLAGKAGTALDEITRSIIKNTDMIKNLAISSDQVNEGTQQLSSASQQISSTIQQLAGEAQELADIALELQQMAAKFKAE
ncbi:methyl-accepting chemotaxis protein [Desulfallas thermosapovorans]|uniref:Methyl-accepting chemotaxis sensory transducer with Cache sensor n=1 Tax=Desulfallas thermosapovorans DSM 6562 TaxID=1121431 RepID=A0A5S4ZUP8_9FIRM|nr:methyl-accepting chemotaxis protein [Desulfallas thermosapovorans]TYO95945.1 methyl-accepting chemotaxis sensory transducer with Cache sensor [Desulfallas thermosapovorans DSM 6562]